MLGLAIRARPIVPLPWLPIVGYHRIDDPNVVARETDEGVVDVTAADFERHVAFVAQRFDVIGIDALRRYFVEKVPLPKNPALRLRAAPQFAKTRSSSTEAVKA